MIFTTMISPDGLLMLAAGFSLVSMLAAAAQTPPADDDAEEARGGRGRGRAPDATRPTS